MPKLRFDVEADGAQARRELASTRGEVEKFGRSADGAGAASERNRGKLSRFGGALGGVAKLAGGLALAGAGAAVLKFGGDAIRAASDTQQAFGAVEAVFGKNSEKVKAWANGAATSVGLARSEYANLAATLGATLKNSGIEDFAGQSRKLISQAADMASTFGGTTKDAVEALTSALRGETDPIERYGVSLKQSTINAYLASKGQDKLTGSALVAAQQQARLALISQQTAVAQGSFARESNTLAGQQQRLGAQFTNVKDKLGQALLPALTRLLSGMNGLFNPSEKTRRIFRQVGDVARSYLSPIVDGLRRAVDKVRGSFDSSSGKGEGLKKILKLLGDVAKIAAPLVGKLLGKQIEILGDAISGILWAIDKLVAGLEKIVSWAGKAIDKLKGLGKIPGVSKIGGLFSSGDPRMAGLARVSGGGFVGGSSSSPAINLTSSPRVTVEIDSPALARLFRVIVRDELQQLGASGGVVI